MSETAKSFPHPAYAAYVLQPAFESASNYLYEPMLLANQAQAVMLARQNIISAENAQALLKALAQIKADGLAALGYQAGVEDLFFRMEGRVIDLIGPEFGGNLQLARSRNDLGPYPDAFGVAPPAFGLVSALRGLAG